MGWLDDLFSSSQAQTQNNQSSQTGTSNTSGTNTSQSNAYSALQPYLQSQLGQLSNANGTNYLTSAGDQQSNVASGLTTAQNTANNLATSGITADSINSYMSPYTQNVVNTTQAAQNLATKQGLSDLQGNSAVKGALGNNTGQAAAYLSAKNTADQAQIASLYNQGYTNAQNTAAQSAQLQNSAANTSGSLANSATNANTATANIGSNLLSNLNSLYNTYGNLSGTTGSNTSNTTSSGTSTGTGTTTGTSTPSIGGIATGLLGSYLSGLGGAKGKASGGRIDGVIPSYSPDSLHDKVGKYFQLFQGLRKSTGGPIPGYAKGGDVGIGSWTPVVTDTAQGPTELQQFGTALKEASNGLSGGSGALLPSSLGSQQQSLSSFLDSMNSTAPIKGYDDGGAVSSAPTDPAPQPTQSDSGLDWKSFVPTYSTGVWAGEQMSPTQRLGAALTQVGDSPFAGFGKAMFESNDMRLKQMEQERQNRALGLEAQLNPAKLEQMNASAALARTQADKQFLLDIEKKKMEYQKELELQQMQNKWNLYNKITGSGGTGAVSPGSYTWVPAVPSVAPGMPPPEADGSDGAEGEP